MSKNNAQNAQIQEVLTRGVSQVTVSDSITTKLASGKTLRIKHGVDPTTADLHLGYAVVYRKLKKLQDMGHTIVLLIGDFTARLGDPTGRLDARVMRGAKEVHDLAATYLDQAGAVLDIKKTEVRYNSEWYGAMSAEELIGLLARFSAWRLLERDMFVKRRAEGKELRMSELIYPVLQAYDSVMLKSDLTVIGSDQVFNETQARHLQEDFGQAPQDIIGMDLLVGTDGKEKMSQSKGNYIRIRDDAPTQFGKVMSIPDSAIAPYYTLLTDVEPSRIKSLEEHIAAGTTNPRDIKMDLAEAIVSQFHDPEQAAVARKQFVSVFTENKFPEDATKFSLSEDTLLRKALCISGAASSTSVATRLIEQGGVSVDGQVVKDKDAVLSAGKTHEVKAGKKKFIRFTPRG
jgi:tyrosyl-tRNA synthetase